ncbi:MAG: glycosyltransferase [Gemmatimonadetes bacterium]|nr:glycosyltransferase [Gemmatimonadota bacterium]
MDLSVIVSTYNKAEWLEKVLWGYLQQDFRDFELLVADDGSGENTRELIAKVARDSPFPVRHILHPDDGYRRSIILNAAIVASRHDYLVFSDGDCIPRSDFVRAHAELAEPGRFLSGGSVYLSMDVSRRISTEDVASGRFAEPAWLREQGQKLGRHRLRLVPRDWRAALLDRLTTTNPTWNLNNASTWRDWIFAANGMEAEMQYGGADRALGSRLENLGLKGKRARFRAVLVHLDHDRPYKTKESIQKNKAIRRRIVSGGETRARDGLEEMVERGMAGGFLEFGPGEPGGFEPDWNH